MKSEFVFRSNSSSIKSALSGKVILKLIYQGMKSQVVLSIAIIAAFVTCLFIPIDKSYVRYFDLRTLACLFCTLAVVEAIKNIHFFEILAKQIVVHLHNTRNAITALVFITYFASMLLANDMALLTFLPLGYFVLDSTNKRNYMAFTFIMQNIAANLGGMITPFGNPQNLFLYSYFNIPTATFFRIMFLPFLVATILIILCCLCVKKQPLKLKKDNMYHLPAKRMVIYTTLFVCSILIVFRVLPYELGTFFIVIILFFMDKRALTDINYPLLFTFCAFFVFSGNMARIPVVSHFFHSILPKSPLIIAALSCQFISNVPSAVLLSRFTTDYANLLVAVNVGGCGTLIASLASLITFTEYKRHNPTLIKSYLVQFLAFNFGFLAILIIVQQFFG